MESVTRSRLIEENVPIERLRQLLSYNPETGVITRIASYGRAIEGQEFHEAIHISVDGYHIRANRIAWALHNGMWPPVGYWVDHKNTIKVDNRITNLRLATPTQNQQNKAGYGAYAKGVTWRDRIGKPWQAKIRVNGERFHLGSFASEEEASKAYQEACLKYHGEFACPT